MYPLEQTASGANGNRRYHGSISNEGHEVASGREASWHCPWPERIIAKRMEAYESFPRLLALARVFILPREGAVVVLLFPRAAPPRFPPREPPRVYTCCAGRSVLFSVGAPLPRPRAAAPRVKRLPRATRPRSPPLPPRGVDMFADVSWVVGMRQVVVCAGRCSWVVGCWQRGMGRGRADRADG
jgi:hypothetical protein